MIYNIIYIIYIIYYIYYILYILYIMYIIYIIIYNVDYIYNIDNIYNIILYIYTERERYRDSFFNDSHVSRITKSILEAPRQPGPCLNP